MLFSKKRGKVVGIDIGTTSVKVLEFSGSVRSPVVERYGFEPIEAEAVVDRTIKNVESVATSLDRALKMAGVRAKRAAVCIQSGSIISKIISVRGGMNERELETTVEIEAGRIVPNIDEVNIDFVRLGESPASSNEEEVLVVVCRRNVIDDIVSVLAEVNLEPAVVDVDIFVLNRIQALANQGADDDANATGTRALIDFGCSTRLMVFHDNRIVYNQETPFGGRQLIDNIHEKYDMPEDEAMMALRSGKLPDDFKADVLKPFVRSLSQEVARVLRIFYSTSVHNSIDSLVITGGCAHIGNIQKIIERAIRVPTKVLNPFTIARVARKINGDRFSRDIPGLTLASGLALRGME